MVFKAGVGHMGPPLRVNAVLIVIPAHAGIQGM